ncbi:MAG: hypothetical protein M3Y87_04155 [Myxococcota bacterium]|nr:hypothetical protein [Myxococcota bacterium]
MSRTIIACFCALALACGADPAPAPAPAGPPDAAPIEPAWVSRRVDEARARLDSSEGGRLVAQAIEAHGGLSTWLAHGTIEFDFDYQPLDRPERRMNTRNRVDLWRSRATQRELGEGADAELGWDGERAWIRPGPDAFPSPARFWATTPFYFVGIPFVLSDAGVRLEMLDDAELDGVVHHVVKASFEPGTGDSPGDYYVLYVHPDTNRVSALRYVVAYPGFFPSGGHSPEKLMRVEGLHEVSGVLLPARLDTHAWDGETQTIGDRVTAIEITNVRFGERWPASTFAPPREGATVIDTIEPAAR